MARASHSGSNSWIAFGAGAVAALALLLTYAALRTGLNGVALLRDAEILPSLRDLRPPRLPDAPRLPNVPTPRPQ